MRTNKITIEKQDKTKNGRNDDGNNNNNNNCNILD
jgi:hypothetical protein